MLIVLMMAGITSNSPGLTCRAAQHKIVVTFPPADAGLKRTMFAISSSNPRDLYHIIVDDQEHYSPYKWNTQSLTIDTKQQKGAYWQSGKRHVSPVFSRPGTYTLIFSDILETEPENMASMRCMVKIR